MNARPWLTIFIAALAGAELIGLAFVVIATPSDGNRAREDAAANIAMILATAGLGTLLAAAGGILDQVGERLLKALVIALLVAAVAVLGLSCFVVFVVGSASHFWNVAAWFSGCAAFLFGVLTLAAFEEGDVPHDPYANLRDPIYGHSQFATADDIERAGHSYRGEP